MRARIRLTIITFALSAGVSTACGSDEGQGADTAATDTGGGTDTAVTTDVSVIDTATDTGGSDTSQGDTTQGDIVAGEFGAPCQSNVDCNSGYCVEGPEGFVCTRTCIEECPADFDCRAVQTAGADVAFLCLPRIAKVCLPCKADYQCTGGACLEIEGSGQCASTCASNVDCPDGFTCAADAAGEHAGTFCQPTSGSCQCTPEVDGSIRTCVTTNALGTCYGVETCTAGGWGGCTAATAEAEVCDGRDNDCDALVDDGLGDDAACENTIEGVGTCSGQRVCVGVQGWVCTAAEPEIEVCDFRDNDCDGAVDEDFKDEAGAFTLTAHCGTCGNDCADRIPHGVGACAVEDGAAPVCVVASCDPDYIMINRFQCALPPDTSCQPCGDDDDCYGGSCVRLDGQDVCVTPCGDEAGACGIGYACEEIATGVERCMPVTDSCVCSAATDGALRTCSLTNAAGTCFGVETCDAAVGWSGCSADEPADEVCNGQDDDCNGRVDDGVEPPVAACESHVAGVGTCVGTWYCNDPDGAGGAGVGWTCSAPTPTAEVCDFLDNNCGGGADEPFRDAAGLYVSNLHCGSCGVSCVGAIPNATAACTVSGGAARCEVASCDPGYYEAGPLTCLPVGDDLCAPCASDANCTTPGDRCLALDGARYCGRDCGAGNVRGTPEGQCPSGFVCESQALGGKQCVPATGSCSCLGAGDDGDTRTCLVSNVVGTCFGQETCDADSGWSTCSARTPAAETCNGVDDDCDSAVDDVPGRGEACIISNGHGACDGVRDCGAGPGLVCVGQTPAPETCNYVDDDCDNTTDDEFGTLFASCSAGRGVCLRYGFEVCNAAGDDTECNAVAGPEGVESCNGLDDDCDGLTDEIFPGKGDVCQAGLGVCARFGTKVCNGGGTALECSASEGPSSDEACDLLDNDCDGQTDETFKTGDRYTAVTACGNCFTNCQAIYARPNAFGVCNTVPATPVCQMQCNGGSYDLNAVPDDGCEFQLDTTAIYVSQSDAAAKDDGGCGGGPSATGGGRYPCKTITFGMGRATSSTPQRGKVLVASGAYNESITLQSGLSLYGGYDALTWNPVRAPKVHITAIFGSGGAGHRKTVIAQGIKSSVTVFDGFTVYGQVAGAVANGEAANSYGIYVRDSNQSLEIRNNIVWGGTGGPGKSGSRGTNGAAGGHGRAGVAAYEPAGDFACYGSTCEAQASAGGAGGTNSVCASGTAGGAGGTAHCPDFDETRDLCSDTTPMTVQTNTAGGFAGSGDNAGAGGTGGCDSMIDPFLEDGDPTLQGCVCRLPDDSGGECPLGQRSAAGDNGAPGQPGTGGGRASSGSGEVASAEWRGLTAGSGGNGTVGSGGGGGGAGGGVETYAQPTYYCVGSEYTDIGGSGGGGGAGGCGGAGGGPGSPGGGSFAIFVVFDQSPGTALPTITQNEVHTGFGGVGGRGGDGGTAGAGGNGGGGGAGGPPGSTFWCADSGSKGGEGGAGGPGGGGGGGVGGASFGMFVSGQGSANLSAWSSNNTVLVDGAGGQGGAGGGAGPGGNAGLDGLVGSSQARNF